MGLLGYNAFCFCRPQRGRGTGTRIDYAIRGAVMLQPMSLFSALWCAADIPTAKSALSLVDDNFFDIDEHAKVPTVIFPEHSKTNGLGLMDFTLPKLTGKAYESSLFNLACLTYSVKGAYTPHMTSTDSFFTHCVNLMATYGHEVDCLWLDGELVARNLRIEQDKLEKTQIAEKLRKWMTLMPSPALVELSNGPGDHEAFHYFWQETQRMKYVKKDEGDEGSKKKK